MTAKAQIAITIEVELPEPIAVHPLKPLARQQNLQQRALAYAKGLTPEKLQNDLRAGRVVIWNDKSHIVCTEIE